MNKCCKGRSTVEHLLVAILVLVITLAGCSADEVFCDPLCEAQILDEKLAGSGKIGLKEREADITTLITTYEDALQVCSEPEVREVEERLDDLKFEAVLIEAIQKAFETVAEEVEADSEFRPDVRGMQEALRKVYLEAEFYEPLDESYSELYEGASVAPDKYSSNYTVWFIIAATNHPKDVPEWFRKKVIEADDLSGYDLTHQFMCLQIQQYVWAGNDSGDERRERQDRLARRIVAEQDDFSENEANYSIDLYAERIYVLLNAGYGELVKREWFERLLNDRLPNGLWPRRLGDEDARSHATHLALLSMAQYQVIFQRGEEAREELFVGEINL